MKTNGLSTLLRGLVSLALLSALAPLSHGETGLDLYHALREARPDGRRVPLQDVTLARDVFTIRFEQGVMHPLGAVDGRTLGAVFLGTGEIRLSPATPAERQAIAFRAGESGLESLADRFDGLVLLFTDGTSEELLAGRPAESGSPDPAALRAFEKFLEWQRKEYRRNIQLLMTEDLMNDDGFADGFFMAFARGGRLGKILVAVDPRGVVDDEESSLTTFDGAGVEIWYSSHLKEEVEAGIASCPKKLTADVEHYELVTSVVSGTELQGTATLTLTSTIPSLRVLRFGLLPSLRIEEAVRIDPAGGEPVALSFVQEGKDEDADPAVFLDRPLAGDGAAVLRIRYSGKGVLIADGDGVYRVEARSDWYPHVGEFHDRATYDLTYRSPADKTLVSVGTPVGSESEGGYSVTRWKVDYPILVAGFNYGKFRSVERLEEKSGTKIRVLTNPGTPDVINEINGYMRAANETGFREGIDIATSEGSYAGTPLTGSSHVNVSTEQLAEDAMADAVNSIRVYTKFFGELPYKDLAVSQQSQWFFGQAWPSLVFVPYIAALDGTARMELGLSDTASFIDEVTIHEIAHQWWGHRVGWESYRDEWLSEGFAEFSAGLVLELTRGPAAADRFWQRKRYFVLGDPRGNDLPAVHAGPITQGRRLITERTAHAYDAVVYSKGAFVLHMLRMLMREADAANPDEKFFAMMRDFATTYAGKNATTEDFKATIEKHMTPGINATRNGKIDWFFDQWVYGTEVPTYRVEMKIEKADKGQYRVVGTVAQEDVSDGFMAMVPLYVDFGDGKYGQFGRAPFKGKQSHAIDVTLTLPDKPKGIVTNAHYEVLAWDPSKKSK